MSKNLIDEVTSSAKMSSVRVSGIVMLIIGSLLVLLGVIDSDLGWLIIGGVLILSGMMSCSTAMVCSELRNISDKLNEINI